MNLALRRPTPLALRSQRKRQIMLSADEVAAMNRAAYLDFLNGESWGKQELVAWLLERYRPIARTVDEVTHLSIVPRRPRTDKVHPIRLRSFIEDTRTELLEDLLIARTPEGRRELEQHALATGLVVPERDVAGRTCYVAVDLPDLRLVDRLRALIAADSLANGEDFARVILCTSCNQAAFDVEMPPVGICADCRRHSGPRLTSDIVALQDFRNWSQAG